MPREQILVIKLSALGDFVQASGPMKAIRAAHPDAHITLLTTGPYVSMGEATGWFDAVWSGGRPAWSALPAVWRLIRRLRKARFDRVYDLQTQSRTIRYFHLLWPRRPLWSGNAPGAAYAYRGDARDRLHIQDSQRNQLAIAGIAQVGPPDVSWLSGDAARFALPTPYALLAPGGAPHRPAKRWPAPLAWSAGLRSPTSPVSHGGRRWWSGTTPDQCMWSSPQAARPWCCSPARATRTSARQDRSAPTSR